jgi:hypothetical protein
VPSTYPRKTTRSDNNGFGLSASIDDGFGDGANLLVHCSGCRTSRSIDLRTIDRHPLASVGGLMLGLRCT